MVYVFKVGVRYNNINVISSARLKCDDLFYAFKHPIYCKVEYIDLMNRVLSDKGVKELRGKYMFFSTTTLIDKSQGGVFTLDGKVKVQKLLTPKGLMKAKTWRTLSRALCTFDEVYSNVSSKLKLWDPDMQHLVNLPNEIITWRVELLSSKYSSSSNYSSVPRNIYGEFLSDDLNDFVDNVISKRKNVWDTIEKRKNNYYWC